MTDIQTKTVNYAFEDVAMTGHAAWDADRDGARPVVMVVHEWWGCNDYPRRRAEMLAELGYVGFAVDLYGGGRTAADTDEASELMNGLLADRSVLRGRFGAALETARGLARADPGKVAAIGYCMGGGIVLHAARHGADLAAACSFHGALSLAVASEEDDVGVTARMVAYHGEADEFVPPDDVHAFLEEVEKARADCIFVLMPGATHGFTNPAATARGEKYGLPLRYSETADRASWNHMQLVLAEAFR